MVTKKTVNGEVCRKCLNQAKENLVYVQKASQYAERIDPDIKTEEQLYQSRIQTCMDCTHHLAGICRKCGCFIEVRAAIAHQNCPDPSPKW